MNAKARMLGMWSTHFADSTGLNPRNVSTAHDLAKLAAAASTYPLIRQYTSSEQRLVRNGKRQLHYLNSNRLVREGEWPILVSKTGYIRRGGSLPGHGNPGSTMSPWSWCCSTPTPPMNGWPMPEDQEAGWKPRAA